MKPILKFAACFVLILLESIASCKKDNSPGPLDLNRRPIAKAGDLVRVSLLSCSDRTGSAQLDGSGSFDPDSNIVSYRWKYLSGPQRFILSNADSSKAKLENISFGDYTFELTVTDAQDLSSKDDVFVTTTLQEHSLDVSFNSTFLFIDDYHYQDFYYDEYYDFTEIKGKVNFSPFGEFNLHISEYTDTANLADSHSTSLYIYKEPLNDKYILGDCSVNFKKLIQTGGGPFSGTINFISGSAHLCNPGLTNLPPLTITGNLDLASKTVTLRIQGKVYF